MLASTRKSARPRLDTNWSLFEILLESLEVNSRHMRADGLRLECRELRVRLCDRDARFEPAHDLKPRPRAIVDQIGSRLDRGLHAHRNPKVRFLTDDIPGERRRRDPDDGHGDAVHTDGATERRAITAEPTLPIVVADDDVRIGALCTVRAGRECAPHERRHAEHRKEVRRDEAGSWMFDDRPIARIEH